MTLGTHVHHPLAHWPHTRPHAVALASESQGLTFADLHAHVQQRAAQLADRQQVARLIMAGRQGLGLAGGFGQQGFRRPRIAFPRRKAGLIDQRRRHQRRILRLSGQAQALLPGAAGGGGVTLVGSQVTQMVETGAGNVWSVGLPRQRYAAIQFATGVGGCAHPPQRLAQLA